MFWGRARRQELALSEAEGCRPDLIETQALAPEVAHDLLTGSFMRNSTQRLLRDAVIVGQRQGSTVLARRTRFVALLFQ
jgi:hypothetical protein